MLVHDTALIACHEKDLTADLMLLSLRESALDPDPIEIQNSSSFLLLSTDTAEGAENTNRDVAHGIAMRSRRL
jgi:hypothetical protein